MTPANTRAKGCQIFFQIHLLASWYANLDYPTSTSQNSPSLLLASAQKGTGQFWLFCHPSLASNLSSILYFLVWGLFTIVRSEHIFHSFWWAAGLSSTYSAKLLVSNMHYCNVKVSLVSHQSSSFQLRPSHHQWQWYWRSNVTSSKIPFFALNGTVMSLIPTCALMELASLHCKAESSYHMNQFYSHKG
jgi:hypothetical protein